MSTGCTSHLQYKSWRVFFFLLVSTRQKLIVIKETVIGSSLKSSLDPFSIAWSLSKSVFNLQDDLRASNASFAICPVGFNICFSFLLFECSRVPYQDSLPPFAELWGRNLSGWGLRRHCLALLFLNSVFLGSLFFPSCVSIHTWIIHYTGKLGRSLFSSR